MAARTKWYIGFAGDKFMVFKSLSEPTRESHGNEYRFVIGPFVTKRGALWAEKYGQSNPHFNNVADAERFSKLPEFA